MDSIRRGRLAGLIWALSVIPTWFAFGYVRGSLVVPGNAAATAPLIAAHQTLYREGIGALWLVNLMLLGFGVILYPALRDSQRDLARLFLAALVASVSASMTMTAFQVGAVLILAPDLAALLGTQSAALSVLFTRLANSGLAVAELLSAPVYGSLGIILYRSRRAPRLIGVALSGMGLGFVLNSFEKLLAPHFYPAYFTQLAMGLGALGGLPTMAWLLWKGLPTPTAKPTTH